MESKLILKKKVFCSYFYVLRNNGDSLRVRNEGIATVDAINVLVNGDIEV